ncbi:MAG: ExeA family protein [Fidelibacterota bacterium]
MYLEYWNLEKKPFENAPDPEFFYFSPEHEEAYLRMLYTIKENKGAGMLSGEYGCGKTTLIRLIVSDLSENQFDIAVLDNPRWTPMEMLKEILYQLGEEVKTDSQTGISRILGEFLYQNFMKKRYTIIIIDEAQLIKDDAIFEELRLLLNYQLHDRFLLTLLLVGQPELRERVMAIPQLEQRLSIKYHLHTFDINNTYRYINHRLKIAGATRPFFNQDAVRVIYRVSYGVPRRINNICDIGLLVASRRGVKEIGPEIIESVI